MDCTDYAEIVAADVDGALSADERGTAEAHLAGCPGCRRMRRQQETIKAVLKQRSPSTAAPAALRQQVVASLAREGNGGVVVARLHRLLRPGRGRLILAGAIAALLVVVLRPLWRSSPPDLLATLAHDAQTVAAQRVSLTWRTSDVAELRGYYRSSGRIDFEQSVEDFSAVGWRLVGGRVGRIGDVDTTFSVYDGKSGKVVCRRFRAGQIALPRGGERVGDIRVFTVDGVTICVIHVGKDVICCLASTMPRAAFVRALTGPEPHQL